MPGPTILTISFEMMLPIEDRQERRTWHPEKFSLTTPPPM